jgi:hypothetical protein
MLSKSNFALISFGLCFPWVVAAHATPLPDTNNLPKVFKADPHVLADVKTKLAAGNPSLKPALDKLLSDAGHALKTKSPSVMNKHRVPPSGDKHDYMSQAPYYWRDTNSTSGKYIRRDGEHNPEVDAEFDAAGLKTVCSSAQTLALAYYFSGDEKYAEKASEFLRIWFLNPATKMNPNLNFGQAIPGEVDGRPAGLISADGLVDVVDAIGLLAGSKSWTAADQKGMLDWMTEYFHWLTTSKIGVGESNAKNNHGTLYDTQASVIALFLGKTDFARKVILDVRTTRIASQIEPDGRQPLELARTRSFHYSLKNLLGLIDLASIGQNLGVDLWHYVTPEGRSIYRAIEFMAPYANPDKKWPYQQITKFNYVELSEPLLRSVPEYPGTSLSGAMKHLPPESLAASRSRLLFKTGSN